MTPRAHPLVLPIAAALALAASAAFAASAPPAPPVQLPPPPAGKGEVVFYRKPMPSLVPFNWYARENGVKICEMIAGTYCVAMVDPGDHTYEVHSEVTNKLTIEVDAGETYYIVGGISMGLIVNHPTITPAEKAQFDAMSAKLKDHPAETATPAEPAPPATSPTPPPPPTS